jgi:DNA gyrase subunit A
MVVTITHRGYAKRRAARRYARRGAAARNKVAAPDADEDFVEQVIVASTRAYLLCFTNGAASTGSRSSSAGAVARRQGGKALVNLLAWPARASASRRSCPCAIY